MQNSISLYKKVDEDLRTLISLEIMTPIISYYENNERKRISLPDEINGVIHVNEYDSIWAPNEHSLEIQQDFTLKNINLLFGSQGVTLASNTIGVAAHIYSSKSGFQKTVSFATLNSTDEEKKVTFSYSFPKSFLRGDVQIDYFLYLQELKEYNAMHASTVGMKLTERDLYNTVIVIDGEGSTFPITEFSEKGGPLWKIEKNWVEPEVEMFDTSTVNLSLNTLHPLFEQLKNGKTPISRSYMDDVIVQAMIHLIQQVCIVEERTEEDMQNAIPGSVLSAVYYWVSTFNVNTSSLFAISNSLRDYMSQLDG